MLKVSQFKDIAQVFVLRSRTSVLASQSSVIVRPVTWTVVVMMDVASETSVVKMTIGDHSVTLEDGVMQSHTPSYTYSSRVVFFTYNWYSILLIK